MADNFKNTSQAFLRLTLCAHQLTVEWCMYAAGLALQ